MTFGRTGWRLAAWYLFVGFMWILAAAILMGFVTAWFPITTWTGEKAFFILMAGLLSFGAVQAALSMHGWLRHLETYFLTIDDYGIHLRLPEIGETRIAWKEIQGITHQKRWVDAKSRVWVWLYRLDAYTILTTRGPFPFTAMEVSRPRCAAGVIAERIGGAVEEIAPVRERIS
jgi:hypothetical protein